MAGKAIATPIQPSQGRPSPATSPAVTGTTAPTTAAAGATMAALPRAKPVYRKMRPHSPNNPAPAPATMSKMTGASADRATHGISTKKPIPCAHNKVRTAGIFLVAAPPRKSPLPYPRAATRASTTAISIPQSQADGRGRSLLISALHRRCGVGEIEVVHSVHRHHMDMKMRHFEAGNHQPDALGAKCLLLSA